MRRAVLLALALVALRFIAAGQSTSLDLQTGAGPAATYTIPQTEPFVVLDDFRIEMRLHDFSCDTTYAEIWTFGGVMVRCHVAGTNQLAFLDEAAGANCYLDYSTAPNDVILRFERRISGVLTCRMWDLAGNLRSSGSSTAGSRGVLNFSLLAARIGGNGTRARVAWVRWYSGVVGSDAPPPQNFSGPGNLGNWELDESGVDSSGYGLNLQGTLNLQATPQMDPIAKVTVLQDGESNDANVVRAGRCFTLSAAESFSLGHDPHLEYSWQDRSAVPSNLWFSDRLGQSINVCGAAFGQYDLRLTVRDTSGRSATADIVVGAVATDDKGVVVHADANASFVFGPQIRYGKSPWPQLDRDQKRLADYFAASAPIAGGPAWDAPLPGKLTFTAGSTTVTASGDAVDLRRDICRGDRITDGGLLVVKHPVFGSRWVEVNSCLSETELTTKHPWPFPGVTDLAYARQDDGWGWFGGSENYNYYDVVKAFYDLHYRTGLTKYLDAARALADAWWNNPSLSYKDGLVTWPGNFDIDERRKALLGLMWRAYEGQKTDWWPGLRSFVERIVIDRPAPLGDAREEGYKILFHAVLGQLDPQRDIQPWRDRLLGAAENRWKPQQRTSGMAQGIWTQWYAGWGDFVYYGATLHMTRGSSVVRVSGALRGFAESGPDVNAMLYIDGDNKGYWVGSKYSGGPNGVFSLTEPYQGETGLKTRYGLDVLGGEGVQPFMLGIQGNGWSYAHALTGDNTSRSFVLDIVQWLKTTGTRKLTRGLYYARVFPSCEPEAVAETAPGACTINGGQASPCDASTKRADRYLNGEIIRSVAQAYLLSPDESLREYGDAVVGAVFGRDGGPKTDGVYVDLADGKRKTFGFMYGIGGAAMWPAARLGGLAPEVVSPVSTNFNLAAVPRAASARVTLIRPDGTQLQKVCADSPCVLEADARQGDHIRRIEYLAADGTVLNADDTSDIVQIY